MNITVSYDQIGRYIKEMISMPFTSLQLIYIDSKTIEINFKSNIPIPPEAFVDPAPGPITPIVKIIMKKIKGKEWIRINEFSNNTILLSYNCYSLNMDSIKNEIPKGIEIDAVNQKAVLHLTQLGGDIEKLLTNADIENVSCNKNGIDLSLNFKQHGFN